MKCKSPQILVPAYCRNPAAPPSRGQRVAEVDHAVRELRKNDSVIDYDRIPKMVGRRLTKAPHQTMDRINRNYALALFELPRFVPWAQQKMLSPKYIERYPNVHARYAALRASYMEKKKLGSIPDVYKLVVMDVVLNTLRRER